MRVGRGSAGKLKILNVATQGLLYLDWPYDFQLDFQQLVVMYAAGVLQRNKTTQRKKKTKKERKKKVPPQGLEPWSFG